MMVIYFVCIVVILEGAYLMTQKRQEKKLSKSAQATVLKKQIHQLHIDLKRGLLPYIILFFLKLRPHYSLEIFRKMSHIDDGRFNLRQNIIYQNLKKFEEKGIVGSYMEKSTIGAKRKYYYLTELGLKTFEEIVINRLDPLMFMFSIIMEDEAMAFKPSRIIPKKEIGRIRKHIHEELLA